MDIQQAFAELGLTPQATQAQAKTAYRMLAMRWHPDINTGVATEQRMKAINVAYALVCQHLEALERAMPKAGRAVRAEAGFAEYDWRAGFTRPPQAAPPQREALVERTIRVSLFEAAFGCVKRVQGQAKSGHRPWAVDVPIHAGTIHGTLVAPRDIRVRTGEQWVPRSFQFTLEIEKHPLFRLEKNRLLIHVPISMWRWALGGEITVPTLQGSVQVSLPPKPAVLLVKNQGWPEYKAPQLRRPLFVMPQLIYPAELRHADRRMLEVLEVRNQMPEVQCWGRHLQAWVEACAQEPD